jgi:hypothetical protein
VEAKLILQAQNFAQVFCSDDKQIQPDSDTKNITYFSWTEEYIREFCKESL